MRNTNVTIFSANSADYGGAMYVDDYTNSGTCASLLNTECFFQVLAIHGIEDRFLDPQSMLFSQNIASVSGSTLYGGLLDRCAVSQFAEVRYKSGQDFNLGVHYFTNISIPTYEAYIMNEDGGYSSVRVGVITNISISSEPVGVCFCSGNEHNCSYQPQVKAQKGEAFKISLVAVDQIGQPVSGIIQTILAFTESGLAEGQLTRKIPETCTNLTFNVVSPHDFEYLTVFTSDGPCKDAEPSKKTVELLFLPCSCPIGLQVSDISITNCTCECHSEIDQYVEQCDSHTGSFVKKTSSRAWISYLNDTNLSGYLVYPNCPFDYCISRAESIDLNQIDGADMQCAYNRSGLLCASCRPGLSLSLDSSQCLTCPSHWPALLVAFSVGTLLAGIALVTLLLFLDMTVAVGTLNGLIFYANIVYANKSILLPFEERKFLIVFISLLNLELGIDTCFFPGMDTYTRTWLQLAFPAYVILLVILVIAISSRSFRFSRIIGKRNPVATLATLILLSYAKFLEICFKSLSVGTLRYPNSSYELLWLPDATVKYLSRKHIPLFTVAVSIITIGLVYTILLFFWQWLINLPKWRIFGWSRDTRIQSFIETYSAPYTLKHRYWTGLLLIVRATLYLVAAVNVTNDPRLALAATVFTLSCVILLRAFTESRVYRKPGLNFLEAFFFLNILSFCVFTWYSLSGTDMNQELVASISVITAFIALFIIIFYHVFTCATEFLPKSNILQNIKTVFVTSKLQNLKSQSKCHGSSLPDNNLSDITVSPVNKADSGVVAKLTYSVVDLHQLEPPDPAKDAPEILKTDQVDIGKANQIENEERLAID